MKTHPAFVRENVVIPIINTRPLNRVVNFNGFHLSYDPSSRDYGSDTTGIVFKGRVFFVLNGDHSHGLHAAVEAAGVQGAIDYFIEHQADANKSSEHLMVCGQQNDLFELTPTVREIIGQDGIDRLIRAFRQ